MPGDKKRRKMKRKKQEQEEESSVSDDDSDSGNEKELEYELLRSTLTADRKSAQWTVWSDGQGPAYRKSPSPHGLGLFACRALKEGKMVGWYGYDSSPIKARVGEKNDKVMRVHRRRYERFHADGSVVRKSDKLKRSVPPHTPISYIKRIFWRSYYFVCGNDDPYGMQYANHSDDPTLVVHPCGAMYTRRPVAAGDELTLDYGPGHITVHLPLGASRHNPMCLSDEDDEEEEDAIDLTQEGELASGSGRHKPVHVSDGVIDLTNE